MSYWIISIRRISIPEKLICSSGLLKCFLNSGGAGYSYSLKPFLCPFLSTGLKSCWNLRLREADQPPSSCLSPRLVMCPSQENYFPGFIFETFVSRVWRHGNTESFLFIFHILGFKMLPNDVQQNLTPLRVHYGMHMHYA